MGRHGIIYMDLYERETGWRKREREERERRETDEIGDGGGGERGF